MVRRVIRAQEVERVVRPSSSTSPCQPEILLHPNIPRPLHGLAPRTVMGTPWWNRERAAAYKATDYHCAACGVHKTKAKSRQWLEGHETYDIDYTAGTAVYLRTVALCHYCHNYIHDGRLRWLLEGGQIHHYKFVAIIQHGDSVLTKHGLTRPHLSQRESVIIQLEREGRLAPFDQWRLVINETEYRPTL